MDSTTDIELTITGLTPTQARDVWARINIIAAALITDGYNVAYGRDTYTDVPDDEQENNE